MSRQMYDSTNPNSIPTNAQMVAGYIDGTLYKWPDSVWSRFPDSVKVRIARRVTTNDGHVLDVELGIPTVWPPSQRIVDWVQMRRASGMEPTIYCNQLNDWQNIRQLFINARVKEPQWWVARYNNVQTIPKGAIAKQYANPPLSGGHYDLSVVADFWPGVDGNNRNEVEEDMALKDEFFEFVPPGETAVRRVNCLDAIANLYIERFFGSSTTPWTGPSGRALDLATQDVAVLAGLISDQLVTAGISGATPAQCEQAVRNVLTKGVDNV
jgi:hypothetical protein